MNWQLLVAGLVVVSMIPGGAMASVSGSPDISISLPDGTVAPGTDTTLGVRIVNSGNLEDGSIRNPGLNGAVTTARNVSVSLDASDAPFEIETRVRTLGRLPQGGGRTLGFQLSVPDEADPGTYTVPVTVTYTYTESISEVTGARQIRDVERTFEVSIEIRETPQFRVVNVTHGVRIGASGPVTLTLANVGAATAHETSVAVQTTTGDLGFGGGQSATRHVGSLAPGETRTVSYRVRAAPGAERQAYAFTATASYEEADGDAGQSEPLEFTVRPGPEQRFTVELVRSSVAVGETGGVTVRLRNAGPITVTDATVRLTSNHAALGFRGAASATRFVGSWAPGESRTVSYRMTASDSATTRSYALSATVAYDDVDGDRRTETVGSLGVVPAPEQAFAYRDVSVTLRGSLARVTGRVVNTGERSVDSALVTVESPASRVRVTDGTHPVGRLDPGESAPFSIGLRVAPNARPGPRELDLSVQYEGASGRTYTSDASSVRVPMPTAENDLVVTPVSTTLRIDDSNTVRVRVRNAGADRLTDVRARLAVRPPYESESPTAYVASLAPGESVTLTFELTTPEDDVPTTDAIALNVSADIPTDQRVRFGPYFVPVTTTAPGGQMQRIPTLGVGAVVAIVLVVGGWWWFN